ncbi:hypothetical protein SBI_01464 [Streptomyces bingchenggensis BCW-1]|uniref:Uncharacterized protein n=1 Tax=Streptomyces bingchenggensis (strain BCW-1) TaxID=749414 RepID=D7CDS0_STRBB|nr:hypothetical protein SBI_01464 [Streptomyces bingchenggensis BCW-1]
MPIVITKILQEPDIMSPGLTWSLVIQLIYLLACWTFRWLAPSLGQAQRKTRRS